jgi:hypothetical protein
LIVSQSQRESLLSGDSAWQSAATLRLAHEALALRPFGDFLRKQRIELDFVGCGLCGLAGDYRCDRTDVACE